MGKGGYYGGSTIVEPRSDWFTDTPPKSRRINRASAVGDAIAKDWQEQRSEWDYAKDKRQVLSREEVEATLGRKPKAGAAIGSSNSLSKANRKARQAEKRRRLGISGDAKE